MPFFGGFLASSSCAHLYIVAASVGCYAVGLVICYIMGFIVTNAMVSVEDVANA